MADQLTDLQVLARTLARHRCVVANLREGKTAWCASTAREYEEEIQVLERSQFRAALAEAVPDA